MSSREETGLYGTRFNNRYDVPTKALKLGGVTSRLISHVELDNEFLVADPAGVSTVITRRNLALDPRPTVPRPGPAAIAPDGSVVVLSHGGVVDDSLRVVVHASIFGGESLVFYRHLPPTECGRTKSKEYPCSKSTTRR